MQDAGLIPVLGRSPGEGNGHPFQYSCLENSVGRGAWRAIISVQFSSAVQSCLTLCDPINSSTPGLPVHHHSWSLLKLMCIESVMPSNHLILCGPLLLLPSVFPSIRVFSNESALCIRWPKYWSFSSVSVFPMNLQR